MTPRRRAVIEISCLNLDIWVILMKAGKPMALQKEWTKIGATMCPGYGR